MKFYDFCEYLQKLEQLSSRNEMTEVLADLIKNLKREELPAGIYLLQGQIAAQFMSVEFNFSTKLLLKSLAGKSGVSENLSRELTRVGDIGLLLEGIIKNEGRVLSLEQVYRSLLGIALLSGKDSQSQKMALFRELVEKMSPLEAKFCGRIIVGKLRLGVSDKTILDALSWAVAGDKVLKPLLEKAYGSMADLPVIAESLLFEGVNSLEDFDLKPGVPVSSKLVEREKDLEKVFERQGKGLIVQPKYDGLRMQIHYSKDGFEKIAAEGEMFQTKEYVRLFSRNMSNITDMFPEVVRELEKLPVQSVVIDSEAIGVDPLTGQLLPFQDTIQRKRKYGVVGKSEQIPVKVFCFDILYLDGESYLHKDLKTRLAKLAHVIEKSMSEILVFSESVEIQSVKELQDKFDEYKDMGLEGLISKIPDGHYEPGTRNFDWIKFKVKAQEDLADSFDAVILGYYRGSGVRTKFGIGAILVGMYDEENDRYISLAKVGTGFKDDDWGSVKAHLDEYKTESLPQNVLINALLMPDVLVFPEVVCIIEADEISKSKLHGGGDTGYSLRFPRFKGLRKDKSPTQATTVLEVQNLYKIASGK